MLASKRKVEHPQASRVPDERSAIELQERMRDGRKKGLTMACVLTTSIVRVK